MQEFEDVRGGGDVDDGRGDDLVHCFVVGWVRGVVKEAGAAGGDVCFLGGKGLAGGCGGRGGGVRVRVVLGTGGNEKGKKGGRGTYHRTGKSCECSADARCPAGCE